MSVERYNAERYSDPTAHAALTAVTREERERGILPRVYVCSPYAGDTVRNAERARGYARFAFSKGKHPMVPHIYYPQFMNDESDPVQRKMGLSFALEWLAQCEEIWVFGEKHSAGMLLELAEAERLNITVRKFAVIRGEIKEKENLK